MKILSPVVWREGMHLAQHHFQLQSRFVEDSTAFAAEALYAHPAGLASLQLDPEAVTNGTVAVIEARGLMPDGLAFQFPEEPVPNPLHIRERFSPTAEGHVVALTIPAYQPGGANCAPSNSASGALRYVEDRRTLTDEVSGVETQVVEVVRKNFALTLDPQPSESSVSLPLARVVRDGKGMFRFDPDFIPPILQIGASTGLVQRLTRLIEILDAKARALREGRAAPGRGRETGELAAFWLSHAVHSSLSPLRHLRTVPSESPERLYREMARLAGALCTFSMDLHPSSVPLYDSDDLGRTFRELDEMIRRGLEVVLPTGAVTVPLASLSTGGGVEALAAEDRAIGRLVHAASITDARAFQRPQWYLGVRSSLTGADVAHRVPELVKVCSAGYVVRLVREAHRGLELEHVRSPSAELTPRPGMEYFRVLTQGPAWSLISKARDVGVYVPAAVPDAELDLVFLVDG